ncbi:MAG: AAA family ATPase, partial [Gammaproteobacteria bacterium]|nr:AAA family ATPase [Gammaproteobacteria bacterium]
MYTAHFGLKDNPFTITPDPGYLYLSPHHQDALAHLLYGIGENGGFVQLTGEVGTGKTTLIRALLAQPLEQVDVALCFNPRLTVRELVATLCDELHVPYPEDTGSLKPLYDALNAHLLRTHAEGRRTVLIIDEAQNLSRPVLEQIRLLTNLETHRHKLLRIILVGQPELQHLLERQDMRQLAQRITARYHLRSLTQSQTTAYIQHRLRVAGGPGELFTSGALRAAFRLSNGVPRLINVICDRALTGAYGRGLQRVDATLVRRAAREALGHSKPRFAIGSLKPELAWTALAAGLAMFGVGLYLTYGAWLRVPRVEAKAQAEATSRPANEPASAPIEAPVATKQAPDDPPRLASAEDLRALLGRAPDGEQPWTRLLTLWGESWPAKSDDAPCEQVQTMGLRCLSGIADWDELGRYNRPALLRLGDSGQNQGQAVLRSLRGDQVTLLIGNDTVRTDTAILGSLWKGEYLLLWRPQISPKLIGPGTQGDAVIWLRQRLALALGHNLGDAELSSVFDPTLQDQVRSFQKLNNLE